MESLTPLRLPPGADLRDALQAALAERGAQAAFVVAGIGSLKLARLRLAGCIVRTTAEVLIAWLDGWSFAREPDAATGCAELVARRVPAR
jgi:uncharacterized protein